MLGAPNQKDNNRGFVQVRWGANDPSLHAVPIVLVTRSAHKMAVFSVMNIQRLVHEVPDCVVIAYVGRSNGLGPALAGAVSASVITVPASLQSLPDDVWSSLRMPSDIPLMTVLDPKNAMLEAFRILAARNPALYADIRMVQEENFSNVVPV